MRSHRQARVTYNHRDALRLRERNGIDASRACTRWIASTFLSKLGLKLSAPSSARLVIYDSNRGV